MLRAHLPMMLFLSFVGFAYNNAISYLGPAYTEALNALLISRWAAVVALWSGRCSASASRARSSP